MAIGENLHLAQIHFAFTRQRIELADRLDIVAEKFDAPRRVLIMRREYIDDVAAHAKRPARKIHVVAFILQLDQFLDEGSLRHLLTHPHRQHHLRIGFGRTDTVNARHRCDDDTIGPRQHGTCRAMAHAVDLLVDRGIFFNIDVAFGDIGFRLEIIVIGYEIFHRVVREKTFHLRIQLRGKCLVMRHDKRRALRMRDNMRHGERLSRTGNAQQHLLALFVLDSFDKRSNGGGLIARRLKIRHQFETGIRHGYLLRAPPIPPSSASRIKGGARIITMNAGMIRAAFCSVA